SRAARSSVGTHLSVCPSANCPPPSAIFLPGRGASRRWRCCAPCRGAMTAVDETYPLAGEAVLDPALPLADALAGRDGAYGIVADAALLGRLGLAIGNRLTIGGVRFELRAVLVSEPDRLASGIRFGAPALISQQ